LAATGEVARQAYEHQNLPFDMLVAMLNPERAHHAPVFQVKFKIQHGSSALPAWSELVFEPMEPDKRTAQLDMIWTVTEADGKLSVGIEYQTGLFLETTMQRLARHFLTLLTRITQQPDVTFEELAGVLHDEQKTLKKKTRKKFASFSTKGPRHFTQKEIAP
jgi:non-ribosomal peptide synthetase component F